VAHSRTISVLALLTLLSLGAILGCGKPEPVGPTKISGIVSFQNRPLAGGLIVFSPDSEKGASGKTLRATINENGEYFISADSQMLKANGWYRVAIADPPGVFTPELGYPDFPKALRRPDRSGLQREILLGKEHVFHFQIEVPE
jgi:hypothetical protein